MAGRHPQTPAQAIATLGNDLVARQVHHCQKASQPHFQTLEFSDELVESRGTRLACPTGVVGHTVVCEVEYPAALKAGRFPFELSVEELNQSP